MGLSAGSSLTEASGITSSWHRSRPHSELNHDPQAKTSQHRNIRAYHVQEIRGQGVLGLGGFRGTGLGCLGQGVLD